jgi:ankyrin repeat protein
VDTKLTQSVKPHAETYLLQAAMQGNIAFLEIYIRCKGSLIIEDQRGRNALHHAVANGHRQFATMVCEFGLA